MDEVEPGRTGRRARRAGGVGRRSLLQAGLVALGAAAGGMLRGGRSAEAGRQTVFLDEPNVRAATTAIRSDVAQETVLVENRAPGGAHRVALYGYLGTPQENRPLLGTNAGVAAVSNDGGAALYALAGASSAVAVKAESQFGTALEVKGGSSFSGPASFDGAVEVKGSLIADHGSLIDDLAAYNIRIGTLDDARLSANIPRKGAKENKFTGILHATTLRGDAAELGKIKGPGSQKAPIFASAGVVTVPKGRRFKEVKSASFSNPKAIVIATAQSPGGSSVEVVYRTGPNKFTFYLSEEAELGEVNIGYLVVRMP